MKKIISILLAVLFIGCNQENSTSPTSDISHKYLGLSNTTREYEASTWEFIANTDTPIYSVPDSLVKKLSFDSISLKQGLVRYERYKRIIINRDSSFNQLTYYNPSIKYYQERTIDLDKKKLGSELDYAKRGLDVPKISLGSRVDGTLYIENETEYYTSFSDTTKNTILKKPLEVGSEWIREKRYYKNDKGVFELFQEDCKVVSKEEIIVKAGKFTAYKIEVTNNWVALNYKALRNYEYYVPSVGLVLLVWDVNLYSTNLSSTVYFRQKYRVELVNYSFVIN